MPELHIITGSNGAGKSSIGSDYLPDHIRQSCEVFNGDKVFEDKKKELYSLGIKAFKEARNIAGEYLNDQWDRLVDKHLTTSTNFAYEGHFTNDATWNIPKAFKEAGFSIHMIFLGLRDKDLSMLRVIDRKKEGGHFVQEVEVISNFYGNLEKLNIYYEMFDSVQIIDTSELVHKPLATYQNGKLVAAITREDLPAWFIDCLPNLANQIP